MAGRRERSIQARREAEAARSGAHPDTPATGSHAVGADEPTAHGRSAVTPAGGAPANARERRRASRTEAGETAAPQERQGKGRPTPKRKEAQARNRRPVVETDRKAARRRQKAERDAAWRRQQAGIAAGDERYFLPRDRGPARAFARDHVDSRWNLGELMLPAALSVFLLLFLQGMFPQVVAWGVTAIYVVLLIALLDSVVVALTVTRRAKEKFGADAVPRWTGWYAAMRALQLRALRTPKPRVARGRRARDVSAR